MSTRLRKVFSIISTIKSLLNYLLIVRSLRELQDLCPDHLPAGVYRPTLESPQPLSPSSGLRGAMWQKLRPHQAAG